MPEEALTDIEILQRQLERERAARQDLEHLAERGMRQLYEKNEATNLLARIAQAANDAPTLEEALQLTLKAICAYTSWPLGHVYRYHPHQHRLVPTNWWYASHEGGLSAALRKATAETSFGEGEGLPGRVWATRQPAWVENLNTDHDFLRTEVTDDLGVGTAFAFPVVDQQRVVAVIEFFAPDALPPNDEWLRHVKTVGTMLGRVAEREANRDLLEANNSELERSNKELQQFAYVASHDLQEPLRMVAGFLELLERRYGDALDENAHKYINFAVEGAKRMRTLINDLLRFSRVTTQAQPPTPVDLNKLAEQVKINVGVAIAESDARITIDPLPTVPADPSQLRQVFQNLIENAIKFRKPDHAPTIHISADDEGEAWALSVADQGIGIAPEHRGRIFELFQRLHTRDQFAGNGIGLTLVRKIIERHGGALRVTSTLGEGTTFTFTLPKQSPIGKGTKPTSEDLPDATPAPDFADSP